MMDDSKPGAPQAETAETFVPRLGQSIAASARADMVYGEPVEREGVTVIPVAKIRYGFGGGRGRRSETEQGAGGGGGVAASPLGYIELRDGQSDYRPIRDPVVTAGLLAVGGLVGLATLRALARLLAR